MKSIIKNKALLVVSSLMILAIIMLTTNCQNNPQKAPQTAQTNEDETAKAIVVPPNEVTFENSPPIVEQLFIKRLDQPDSAGNNVLLIAKFPQSETRLATLPALTLTLNDQRRVSFADNGQRGDLRAADGLFTAPLRVNESEVLNLINRNNELIKKKDGVETAFVGRSATRRKLNSIILDSFKRGLPVIFDLAFISIVDATTLPDIKNKSLMVVSRSVVEDLTRTYDPCRTPKGNPNGAWSFKTLVSNMANGFSTPEQFLVDWVNNFLFSVSTLPLSGDATTDRVSSRTKLIRAWLKNCGIPLVGPGVPAGWQTNPLLKAEEFPVRLLAIINRLDLRGNSGYGGFSNSGEGRFVFCFIDSNTPTCSNGNNIPGTMTFILEYGVPLKKCTDVKDYATKWWNLRTTPFDPLGAPGVFNSTLEAITKVFTAANANIARPNKSALNHFRTNDFLRIPFDIAQDPWDIRDFEIDAVTHKLKIIHPNKEPMEKANGAVAANIPAKLTSLVTFVNGLPITVANPNPVYTIPSDVAGMHAPMRVPPGNTYHWRGNTAFAMIPLNRREFSLNTCSGCHKGETKNEFTHVRPRAVNTESVLSGFMTGLGNDDNSDPDGSVIGSFFVKDPDLLSSLGQKEFNEALRRAIDLEKLIFNSPCNLIIGIPQDLVAIHHIFKFRPLNMEH